MQHNRDENQEAKLEIVAQSDGNGKPVEERVHEKTRECRQTRHAGEHHVVMRLLPEMQMPHDRMLKEGIDLQTDDESPTPG